MLLELADLVICRVYPVSHLVLRLVDFSRYRVFVLHVLPELLERHLARFEGYVLVETHYHLLESVLLC